MKVEETLEKFRMRMRTEAVSTSQIPETLPFSFLSFLLKLTGDFEDIIVVLG